MSTSCSSGAVARPSTSARDLWCVVGAGLLWGTGGLTGALLGEVAGLDPLAIATYRLLGGGLSLLVALACLGRLPRLGRSGAVRVLAVGALSALYQACYFAAVAFTNVAVATLITLGSAPVLVIVVETVRQRQRPSTGSLTAVGLALLGLGLLVGIPSGSSGGGLLLGTVLAVVSAAGFAALTLVTRHPVPGLDARATVGYGFTVGAVLLAAISVPTVGMGFAPDAASVGLLLYFAWVPTALAYALFFVGLQRGVSVSSAAVVAVAEPLTATLLGVLVLGEHLTVVEAVGAGLLCLAVLVAGLRP